MTRRPDNTGAETERQFGNLAREGVIESVDADAGKVVVRFGEETTPPIDWLMHVGDTSIWILPTIGQQVSVICPEGDVQRAYIQGGLPSSEMAPLFLGVKVGIRFKDGAFITYDPEAKKLQLQLTGEAEITAPDGVTVIADASIKGDVAIDGDVSITGDVSIAGGLVADKTVEGKQDVVGGGKSLKSHTHSGVSSGTSFSGPPR